jgi:hypothetical protein
LTGQIEDIKKGIPSRATELFCLLMKKMDQKWFSGTQPKQENGVLLSAQTQFSAQFTATKRKFFDTGPGLKYDSSEAA